MKNPSSSPEDSPGPLPGAPTVDDILGSNTIRPLTRQELDGAIRKTQEVLDRFRPPRIESNNPTSCVLVLSMIVVDCVVYVVLEGVPASSYIPRGRVTCRILVGYIRISKTRIQSYLFPYLNRLQVS